MSCFYKCNQYNIKKAEVRQQAIEWQRESSENFYSYGELAIYEQHFFDLGKRYGLLKEFRENGIL